jgi:serine/threonine protein kinase
MGTVYLAIHPIMGRKAAVKVLKPELARDESLVIRFFNEARAANAIRHPNIIDIIDVGMLPEDNVPYMLMEFLEGESLSARLERVRPLPVPIAVDVACQTASALAAAHSQGIVHRDLKPDNLFLVPDETVSSGERVKVLDFGIAKLRDDMRGSSMRTRAGAIMGTAAYMSPEQCQGLIEQVDQCTDVYALGIILYEMLCGAPPFLSEGFGDIIIMHVMREPEPPQRKNPAIPDALAAAIVCALAKDPRQRFQSMAELQAALRGNLSQAGYKAPTFAPSPAKTAMLEADVAAQAGAPFDVAIETPPPATLGSRPPSQPPLHISTQLDSDGAVALPAKQPTTLRHATGEISNSKIDLRGKRRTAVAVAAVLGLAAAGLIVTVLVTRPASKPPVVETQPMVLPQPTHFVPPEPAPQPEPPPRPQLAPEPTQVQPTVTPPKKTHPEPSPNKPGKHHHPVTVPTVNGATPPVTQPPPPQDPLDPRNTERW